MPSIVGRGVRVEVASVYTAVVAPVTLITNANPAILTASAHGFVDKDAGFITSIEGMTNIEGQAVRARSPAANTFVTVGWAVSPLSSKSTYRCAYTPYPEPSWTPLAHAATKSPSASVATAGRICVFVVKVLTRNSPPSAAPVDANR